jgi:hypothetical protein
MSNDLSTFNASLPVSSRGRGVAAKSVALVKKSVEPYAEAFETGRLCEKILYSGNLVFDDGHGNTRRFPRIDITSRWLVDGKSGAPESRARVIADAKLAREILSPSMVLSIGKSIEQLEAVVEPDDENVITTTQAAVMVQALFSAIGGNKKSREDQGRLSACVAMFDPTVSIIGEATKLWDEVPRHPVIVALGIMHLLYEKQVFSPAPKELADAIRKAGRRLKGQLRDIRQVCEQLARAEEIVFDHAREEWAAILTTRKSLDAVEMARFYGCDDRTWTSEREWGDALDEMRGEINCDFIRKAIGKNGSADTTSADVKEGEPVPNGVTPRPMPSELVEYFWNQEIGASTFEDLQYFLTPQHIVLVNKDNKVSDLIDRVSGRTP